MNSNRQYPGPPGILSESDLKLLEESVKDWQKCIGGNLMKFGLPWASFATALQYFVSRRVSNENKVPQGLSVQRTSLWFMGNLAIAMICCLPGCYSDLRKKLSPLEGKVIAGHRMSTAVQSSEGSFQSHDDINFQSNLDPKFDGPSSDFSHLDLDVDISSNENLQVEDIDKQAESSKIPTTTYGDLRKRNRENYYKQLLTSSSPQRDDLQLNIASEPQKQSAKDPFPSTSSRKNQYGDDIE